MEAALARLEAHLAASPDDAKGWAVIAPVYMHLGRFDDAATAFGEILRLEGESADRRAGYGEALVGAAGGVVTADARAAFDKALAEQPGLPAARFYLGLAAEQDGDKSKAIAIYQGLLSETPPDAPWVAALKARLAAVKGESAPSAPAPAASNEAPATTPAASDDAQQATIRGMVERLATRLATSGGGAEEWQRLDSLLYGAARTGQGAGRARFGAQGAGRRRCGGAGPRRAGAGTGNRGRERRVGERPVHSPAPAASNEAPATTPAASDDAQQAMIRGMVERLATRLAQSGGDANEWGRLIRSYAVLREPDKARDALASARKALAGDAAAGPGLDALARELGIEGESAASASVPSASRGARRVERGARCMARRRRRFGRRAAGDDPRHGRAAGDALGAERRRRERMGAPDPLLCRAARTGQGAGRARFGAQGARRRRCGGAGPRRAGARTGNRGRERRVGERPVRSVGAGARRVERGSRYNSRRFGRRAAGAMIRGMVERLATRWRRAAAARKNGSA